MPNVSNPLLGHSLEDTLALIKRKACSVTELTEATLDAFDVIGTELNAVARTEREAALAQATQLDRLNAAEAQRRPLFGAVLAHKDLYSRRDWELRAGSNIVHGAAGVTAAPLKKLDRAGAVDCARLNTVEFALGVTGHNAITGDVKNPWNPVHLPGGSSSGSAAAVAAGIVPGNAAEAQETQGFFFSAASASPHSGSPALHRCPKNIFICPSSAIGGSPERKESDTPGYFTRNSSTSHSAPCGILSYNYSNTSIFQEYFLMPKDTLTGLGKFNRILAETVKNQKKTRPKLPGTGA